MRPAIASRTGSLATAVRHIGWSSRGGPGSTTTVGFPGTTTPGAVPTGSITYAPSGTSACLRLAARTASKSQWLKRAISGFRIAAILSSSSSSRTSSRPVKRATISTVMSSAVGPRPPLVTIRSTPCVGQEAQLRLDVLRAVAADRDVGELDAELEQAVRQPRPVAVPHTAGQDLGAGYDDARASAHALRD